MEVDNGLMPPAARRTGANRELAGEAAPLQSRITPVTGAVDTVQDLAFLLEDVVVELAPTSNQGWSSAPPRVLLGNARLTAPLEASRNAGAFKEGCTEGLADSGVAAWGSEALGAEAVGAAVAAMNSVMSTPGDRLLTAELLDGVDASGAQALSAPWFIVPEMTSRNQFHCHNDNLLSLFTGMVHTGYAPMLEAEVFKDLTAGKADAATAPRVDAKGVLDVVRKLYPADTDDPPTLLERRAGVTLHEFSGSSFCEKIKSAFFPRRGRIVGSGKPPQPMRVRLKRLWVGRTTRAFRGMHATLLSYAALRIVPRLRALMWHAAGVPLGVRVPAVAVDAGDWGGPFRWMSVPDWCAWLAKGAGQGPCSSFTADRKVQVLAELLAPARHGPAYTKLLDFGPTSCVAEAAGRTADACNEAVAGPAQYRVWPPRVGLLDREGTRKVEDGGAEFLEFVRAMGMPVARFGTGASATPWEQVAAMASLDVLVTPHGAGATNTIYMSPHSACLQILPASADHARMTLFQMLASLAGQQYEEWLSNYPNKGDWLGSPVRFETRSGDAQYRATKWWDAVMVQYGNRNGLLSQAAFALPSSMLKTNDPPRQ